MMVMKRSLMLAMCAGVGLMVGGLSAVELKYNTPIVIKATAKIWVPRWGDGPGGYYLQSTLGNRRPMLLGEGWSAGPGVYSPKFYFFLRKEGSTNSLETVRYGDRVEIFAVAPGNDGNINPAGAKLCVTAKATYINIAVPGGNQQNHLNDGFQLFKLVNPDNQADTGPISLNGNVQILSAAPGFDGQGIRLSGEDIYDDMKWTVWIDDNNKEPIGWRQYRIFAFEKAPQRPQAFRDFPWSKQDVYNQVVSTFKLDVPARTLVEQAFLTMLGYAATDGNGGAYWTTQAYTNVVNGMSMSNVPAWLMTQLATADGYKGKAAAQVDKAAQDVLGHVFNADGRNYWVGQVVSKVQGGMNINDVPAWLTDQFKASDEYKAKVAAAAAAKAALEKAMLVQAGTSAISIPATKLGGGGFIFSEQWKAKPADGYVVTFQGRGLNDLFVILATKPGKMDYRPFTGHGMAGESYEIDFGAWGNHRNLLLKNGQYVRQSFAYPADDAAAAKVNDIITTAGLITNGRELGDGTTWDWYWVKYLHGRLSMGKGQNPDDAKSEIMAWQDPAPLAFKEGVYVGFGNYNSADVEFKDIKISSLTWQAPKDYEASLDDATKQVVWAKEFTVGSRGGQFWAFYVDPMTESSIYQYQIGSLSDNPWGLWLKDPKDVNGAAVGKIDSVAVTSDGAMAILSQAGIVYTVDVDKKALTALPMVDDQGVKIELAEQISYGNSKNLWMFDDKSDVIYQFNFDKKVWEARCPAGAASQIAVGLDGETWGLASDGTPARYKGNNQWERKAGQKLNFIAVGSQGAIYGVSQSNLYTYKDGAFVADPTVTGIRQIATNATGQSTIINTIDFMLGVKGKSGVAFAAPTATPPAAQISGGMSGLADILVKSGGKLLDAATQTLFQKGLADLFINVQKESADSKAAYVAFLKTYADNTMFDATTKALMKKQLADATLAPAVAAVAKATAPATTPPLSAEEQKKAADAAQAAADAAKAKVAAATTTADKVAAVAAQKVADQVVAAVKSSTVKVTATAAAKTTKAAVSLTKAKTTAATAAKTDAKAAAAAKTVAAAKTATATKVAAKVTKTTAKATAAAKASTPATKTATTAKAATKTAATATTAKTATATTKTAATTAKTVAKASTAAKTTPAAAVKKATKAAAKK